MYFCCLLDGMLKYSYTSCAGGNAEIVFSYCKCDNHSLETNLAGVVCAANKRKLSTGEALCPHKAF